MDQCLQVFLLSGLFSIRSASSLESTENTRFYILPNLISSCLILSCLYLTDTFGTARALSTGEVGAGQHWTLLPLTLGHTVLQGTGRKPVKASRETPTFASCLCYLRHTSSWCISSPPPGAPKDASCHCSDNSSCQTCSAWVHLLASCRCAPERLRSSPPLDTLCSSRRDSAWRDGCRSTPGTWPSRSAPPLKIPAGAAQNSGVLLLFSI